jgi:hypothetical protein
MLKAFGVVKIAFSFFWAISFVLIAGVECYPAAYYVDFDNGNDSNNGTSTSNAWLNLPGTRRKDDTGFLTNNWAIIKAGDTIYIKGGTIHNSSRGGRISINPTYYNNGTAENYVSIQVSNSWGSGNVAIDGTEITLPKWTPLFYIDARSYIEVKGFSTSSQIMIQNSTGPAFQAVGRMGAHQLGIKLRYMQFNFSSSVSHNTACDFSYSDNFEVRDCVASYNDHLGFSVGGINDQNCDGGKFYDCIAHHNGQSAQCTPNHETCHGFGLFGCTNMEYWRCISYNNSLRGFDFGTASNTNLVTAKLIDCTAYNNGEDGFAASGVNLGYPIATVYWINCISYNNNETGFHIYEGVTGYMYHCVSYGNKHYGLYCSGPMSMAGTTVYMGNCILSNNGRSPVCAYLIPNLALHFQNNLYERGTSALDYLILWNYGRSENQRNYTWTGENNLSKWKSEMSPNDADSHDSVGDGWQSKFVNPATADFHLGATSNCINAGVYLSSPAGIQIDRDGNSRGNPPSIGAYEYLGGPSAPKGVRVLGS